MPNKMGKEQEANFVSGGRNLQARLLNLAQGDPIFIIMTASSCFAQPCPAVSCPVLSHPALPFQALPCPTRVPFSLLPVRNTLACRWQSWPPENIIYLNSGWVWQAEKKK